MKKELIVGIVQEGPVCLNLEQSVAKALALIEQAVEKGAELIVFGECWLSGYPAWLDHCPEMALWNHEPTKAVFSRMYQNSVAVDGPEIKLIGDMARQHQVVIGLGINEIVREGAASGTIFNSFLIIDEKGQVANHHRKLMPTFTEKLVHGIGDGHGLKTVETPFGRLGGLICWEHWMPLTRQAMHEAREDIHIALWPNVHEMLQVASRSYAFEGRCFVLSVGQIMQVRDLPHELKLPEKWQDRPDDLVLRGGSSVIGPDGHYIMEPCYDEGGILIQEIRDLDRVYQERMALDASGHYNRRDVFDFAINRKRHF